MESILLTIGGKELYLDIDTLSETVRIEAPKILKNDELLSEENCDESEEGDGKIFFDESSIQIDVAKYEMYREMIVTILQSNEDIDDKMGSFGLNSTSIPFKLAFNTLLMKGILREL